MEKSDKVCNVDNPVVFTYDEDGGVSAEFHKSMFLLTSIPQEGLSVVESKNGQGWASITTTITYDLMLEGLMREIKRAIAMQRKESGFEYGDEISMTWNSDDADINKAMNNYSAIILDDSIKYIYNEPNQNAKSMLIEKRPISILLTKVAQ